MPVSVLIVGGGSIGERHLRCFQQIGCDVALCESNLTRAAELAAQYKLTQTFNSVEQAAQKAWNAAVICTPANLHVDHAILLSKNAAALLIEKPLCTRLEDVERLRAAMAGKVVQVAYVLRAHPATQQVRRLLSEGAIGALRQVTVVAGQHFPTFRPAYKQIYYARHETGGGAIQDAATHLFDLIQHLAGPLDWLFCDCAHQQLPDVEVEDTVHLVGRSGKGKVLLSLALNQFMAPNETHVQLNGASGSFVIRFHEHRFGRFNFGDTEWTWSEPLIHERDDLFRAQAKRFLAATNGEMPPLCSLDEGVSALRANLAALRSATSRTAIVIEGSGRLEAGPA